MVFPKARLVVSATLFVLWILFLLYLVMVTRDPVILSRPQMLVSNLCVLADIEEHNGRAKPLVRIAEVLYAADGDKSLEGQKLVLENLAELGKGQGWKGPERYLLPLIKRKLEKHATYELTPIPAMPGFPGGEMRIYRATDDALRQFRELK